MPNYSIRLPGVTNTAIVEPVEILAFAALPYYQVSGVLKQGSGHYLTFGDPVAWDAAAEKFIPYAYGGSGGEEVCVGFCRIPGDASDADAPIEVIVGGAVKYSVISQASAYNAGVLTDLKARYVVAADAVIF